MPEMKKSYKIAIFGLVAVAVALVSTLFDA